MKERKQIVFKNPNNKKTLKTIVIIIDQFDVIKEKGIEVENFFSKVARDGANLSIFLVFSTARHNEIRYATMNQIKTKIVGYMFEASESIQILGRSEWKLPDIKGRILIKTDAVYIAQMYLPVKFKNEEECFYNTNNLIYEINQQNNGVKAKAIVVLPEELYYHHLLEYEWDTKQMVALGLHKKKVQLSGYTPDGEPFLIVGPQYCGKTNVLKIIYHQLEGEKYIFDTSKMNLSRMLLTKNGSYAYEIKGYEKIIKKLKEKVLVRREQFNEAYSRNPQIIPKEFYCGLPKYTCFIDDIEFFHETAKVVPEAIDTISSAIECGIHFVVCEDTSKSNPLNISANLFRRTSKGLVLGQCTISNPFNISIVETPKRGEGLLITMFDKHQIKIAKIKKGWKGENE
ncbi:MAG: hypothetical protein ACK5LC_17260 [Coprobacillaceae bacterium]